MTYRVKLVAVRCQEFVSNSSWEPCPDLLQVCPVGPGSFVLVKGEIRELVLSGGFTSGTGDFHN